MGCDIHGWVEKKVGRKWIAICELKDRDRNYNRFAALAGVRGDGPEARGLPPDISDTADYHAAEWGPDGHSHSWMPLDEAAGIFLKTAIGEVRKFALEYPKYEFFGVESDDTGEFRLVFWFDN